MLFFLRFYTILLAILLGVSIFSNTAFASESVQAHIIKEFLSHADKELSRGHVKEAIANYSNAFLLDNNNADAREGLIELIPDISSDAPLAIQLKQFQDLVVYLDNLKSKLDYYKEIRNRAGEKLITLGVVEENALVDEMSAIQDNITKSFPPLPMPRGIPHKSDSLKALNEFLLQEKERLTLALAFVKAQNDRLSQIQSLSNRQQNARKYSNVNSPLAAKPAVIMPQKKLSIREKVAVLENKVKSLSEQVDEKNRQLNHLSGQIVNLSLEISERDSAVNNKSGEMTFLSQEMMELESRLALGEKIIQEKDTEIQSLKKSIEETKQDNLFLRLEMDNVSVSNKDKLIEVTGFLQIYKAKLADAVRDIRNNTQHIIAMQEQLTLAQAKLFEKEVVFEKIHEDLDAVNDVIAVVQKKILQSEPDQFLASDAEIMEQDLLVLKERLEGIKDYLAKKIEASAQTLE